MDLDILYNAIEAESSVAYGEADDLAQDRADNIDRYLGKNTNPAPDGRSQVVDRAVYETIQWMQPSLARIFANGDDVVAVTPVGPEDEAGAKQEGQYLNHVALERNNWPQIFDTASKSALMTKAGYLYAYKKMRRQIEVEKYERQTPEALGLILQDGVEVLSQREYPDDSPQQPQVDPNTGQPVMMPPGMLYDIEIRRVKEDPQFCIEVLPPERCRISKRCKDVQLTNSPYFEFYDWPTVSELRQDGIDLPDDLDVSGDPPSPYDTPEDASRNQFAEDNVPDEQDPSMRRVFTRWCWILHDTDGDGIAELQYCITVGKAVRHREEVNRIPVAVICPDPLPFRHVGLCPADVNSDIQDIKTVIMRGALDNLYLTNNFRTFINDDVVNLDDLLVSRPGGVVRGKKEKGAVFGQDIAPMIAPTVFPQAMEAYGFMEQVNEGRTGVNRYFQGTDQNALNKTASGVQQLSSMAAQRVEHVARMYAPGIVELFSILHELILKAGKFTDRIKLNGQWVTVDPTTWRRRTDFKITVGFAAGNKDAMMARLSQLAEYQAAAAQQGLPIVNARNMYETMIELTKAADLSNPERFWTDPSTVKPPPPQPNPLVEVEQVKGQLAIQKEQEVNRSKEAIAQMQDGTERYKANLEAQSKWVLQDHRAQIDAIMQDSKHKQSLMLEDGKVRSQIKLKGIENSAIEDEAVRTEEVQQIVANISQQMQSIDNNQQQVADLLMQLGKIIAAPRVLVRDKSGKPVASKVDIGES